MSCRLFREVFATSKPEKWTTQGRGEIRGRSLVRQHGTELASARWAT